MIHLHRISFPFYFQGFFPLCFFPSRVTASSAKLIDNIFLTRSVTSSKVVLTNFSDHFLILADVNYEVRPAKFIETTRRIVNKSNLAKLNVILSSNDWSNLLNCNNVDVVTESFLENFRLALDDSCPEIKIRRNKYNVPKQSWITPGLLKYIRVKN